MLSISNFILELIASSSLSPSFTFPSEPTLFCDYDKAIDMPEIFLFRYRVLPIVLSGWYVFRPLLLDLSSSLIEELPSLCRVEGFSTFSLFCSIVSIIRSFLAIWSWYYFLRAVLICVGSAWSGIGICSKGNVFFQLGSFTELFFDSRSFCCIWATRDTSYPFNRAFFKFLAAFDCGRKFKEVASDYEVVTSSDWCSGGIPENSLNSSPKIWFSIYLLRNLFWF